MSHSEPSLCRNLLQRVVAVALGGHGPELADDGGTRLGLQAIHLDLREFVLRLPQRDEDAAAAGERVVADALGVLESLVGRAGLELEGTDAVADAVEHVAGDQCFDQRDEERQLELEPALLAGGLGKASLLLEQHHAEAVEARVAQGLPVLRYVHAKAARPARARRQEHELVDDVLGAHPLLVTQVDEVLHEVSDREVRRIALRAVAELLADAQGVVVRTIHAEYVVAKVRECALDQVVLRHGQPAEQQGDFRLLALGEAEVRHVLDPALFGLEPKPLSFLCLEACELRIDVELFLSRDGEALVHGRVGLHRHLHSLRALAVRRYSAGGGAASPAIAV